VNACFIRQCLSVYSPLIVQSFMSKMFYFGASLVRICTGKLKEIDTLLYSGSHCSNEHILCQGLCI